MKIKKLNESVNKYPYFELKYKFEDKNEDPTNFYFGVDEDKLEDKFDLEDKENIFEVYILPYIKKNLDESIYKNIYNQYEEISNIEDDYKWLEKYDEFLSENVIDLILKIADNDSNLIYYLTNQFEDEAFNEFEYQGYYDGSAFRQDRLYFD